jgi:hypothetical protein
MKNLLKIGIILISCFFLFGSCKKTETAADQPAYLYKAGGYIKGTIVGVSRTGIALNETFTYDKFDSYSDAAYEINTDSYSFYLYRQDPNQGCSIRLSFVRSLTGLISAEQIYISYVKELSNHQLLDYYIYYTDVADVTITNVVFNTSASTITGNYTASVKLYDSDGKEHLSTISGDFNLTVYQVVGK